MNESCTADQMVFTPDYNGARRADGSEISFTRAEAEILRALSQKQGRTVTRGQLLDAISGEGSDRSDRNVDFLISRIRRKLGDDPKTPRFILTRYGEGYTWLPQAAPRSHPEADFIVGPLRGLDLLGSLAGPARRFAEEFHAALQSDLSDGTTVAYAPDLPAAPLPAPGEQQRIEVTFFTDAGQLECILTVRRTASGNVLAVVRKTLGPSPTPALLRREGQDAAQVLLGRTWRSLVGTTVDSPLPVAMHDAAGLPVGDNRSWDRNDRRLRHLMDAAPDDATLKLFYATHIHSKYILHGHDLFMRGEAACAEDEARIEELVLSALPHVRHDPSQRIMAAKLLYFLDRGYADLAVELAESGLRESTDIAASLAIVGQMRSFTGRTEDALHSLDQAARLSDYGSEFHVYTMFMRCQALAAAGDWAGLAASRKELFRVRPATAIFDPLFTDPVRPSFRARAVTMALSRKRARGLLSQFNYVSTRLFQQPKMRENSIRAVLRLFVRRFGEDVVPEAMRRSVPDLLPDLTAGRRKV